MVAHPGPYRSRYALRQMGIGSTTSTPTSGISMWIPTTPALAKAIWIVQRARPAHRIRRKVFGADLPSRQGRLSRSPQSLERIERFYDGRQAEPLLLDPGLHSAPLSRSLTLRERAKLTGLARSGDMETPVSLPGRLINGRTGALFVTSAR